MKTWGKKILIIIAIFFVATTLGYFLGKYFGKSYALKQCPVRYNQPANWDGMMGSTSPMLEGCVGSVVYTDAYDQAFWGTLIFTNVLFFGGYFLIKISRRNK